MDTRIWFSPRALRLHAVLFVVVPAFLAMCAWQLSRALGGNELSWAYVFEWPLFAVYAVYMWWRLLHESTEGPRDAVQAAQAVVTVTPPPTAAESPGEARVDSEMAAYNQYLAQLAERDRITGR